MGPSVGLDWSCHHVDPVSEPTSDLLCCLFWPLLYHPATHILAAFLLPGRLESSRGASKEEGPEGSGLRATFVVGGATAAQASVVLGALL